jgi:acetyl esterase/lipase
MSKPIRALVPDIRLVAACPAAIPVALGNGMSRKKGNRMASIFALRRTLSRTGRGLALGLALTMACAPVAAQQETRLYPGTAPGSESWTLKESVRVTPDGSKIYSNVRDPAFVSYFPDPSKANGSAAILLPGGGLRILAVGGEANAIIRRLTDEGMAVFVLRYRVLQADRASPPPSGSSQPPRVAIHDGNANPAPDNAALTEVLKLAVEDAQATLRIVRANAARWHLDPSRIGMIGASAGGGVAIGAELRKGTGSGPAFLGTLYGPSLMNVSVGPDAPPLFMATEADHGPVTEGLLALFPIWKAAGRPTELHIIQTPRLETSQWLDRFVAWLGEQHMFERSPHG